MIFFLFSRCEIFFPIIIGKRATYVSHVNLSVSLSLISKTNKHQWMLDAPDCEKVRTGNLDRVSTAPRHCPIEAIDVNRLVKTSGGVLQVEKNAIQFSVSGKDGRELEVSAVHGSFMLSNKGNTMKVTQKKKQKVKPGQLIIFEDGEAYEVYRNTEAHA